MITTIGFIISLFSFIVMVYSLIVKLMGHTVAGWTFITISIWLIGGIQMLFLGIIGEYLSRMYIQEKNRPIYVVKSIYHNKQENNDDK